MKRIFSIIFFLLFTIHSKGQVLNHQLYEAVKTENAKLVEALLSSGADANYKETVNNLQINLLILAVIKQDIETVKLLVQHKALIDYRDKFKATPLLYAAQLGNLEIIKYLLKNRADIHAKDDHGNTVLTAAKEGNHPEAVAYFEAKLKSR